MFCEKCGAQLPDDAKFCEKCGSSTVPGAAPAPAAAAVVAAAAPAAPSAFSLALKKFFSNKRNVIITLVALLLVVAAIVAIIIIANQPEKIYIDDYFHVEFEGVDGSGYAKLVTNNKENEKFTKINQKLFGDDFKNGTESLNKYITVKIDMTDEELHSLKNGDKVKIKLEVKDELYEKIGKYKLVLRNKTVKVKGLYKSTQLNVLDYITPVFTGYTGYGVARSTETLTFPLINGIEARVDHDGNSLRIEFYETKTDNYLASAYAYFDRHDHLSNGDSVTLSFDASDYDTSSLYSGYGLILASQSRTYTVSGLTEPLSVDVAKHIKLNFEGLSSIAKMTIVLPESSIKVGDYSVIYREPYNGSTMTDEFKIALIDANDDNVDTISYYADKYYDLKNGDIIKFRTYSDVEYILSLYGVAFPESFEIEVKGLEEPFNADPVGRGTYSFTGYEGYGSFIYDLDESKCVYSTDDGKYKIKLSFGKDGSYYKITVVVADENGRNFLSFYYDAYMGDSLRNGDKVYFNCSEWSSELTGYVKEYGIYFPSEVVFTVEGLAETTTVSPLDNVTYAFSKSGDSITMTLGLKETVITVGENTVNLSIEKTTSWGTEYTKVVATVKDKNGNTIGTGYYQFQTGDLYEGQYVYANDYFGNSYEITKATGIVFNTETYSVIVSAK